MLSGTLLRPELVGAGAPGLLRQIEAEGHEVAPHGNDHVTWQDRVHRFSPARLDAELRAAHRAFEAALGRVFRPVALGAPLATIQVPTTMPTVDELLGRVRDIPAALLDDLRPGLNVFTLHAEVEGGPLLGPFREFLECGQARGIGFMRVDEAARAEREVVVGSVTRGHVPGRSGWVACQAG